VSGWFTEQYFPVRSAQGFFSLGIESIHLHHKAAHNSQGLPKGFTCLSYKTSCRV
jgi:hypothetical protein